MRKVWSNIRARFLRVWPARAASVGFSAVEVLLAATVFGFLATALTGAIIYGRAGTATAGDRAQAIALAEEACEAVRNIRDAAWANLPGTGVRYLAQSGGVWTLTTTPEPAIGIFTRQINIAVIDGSRRWIQCQVDWTTNGVSRQVLVTTYLSNWAASITPSITPGPIMMAYSKNASAPSYRTWNGTTWSAEGTANNAGTGGQEYIVLKSARTRDEAILGTQDSNGAIYIQVWNGTSWGTATQVGTAPVAKTRSFDIAYEKNSDEALIVYTPTASAVDFEYITWNGTSLSSPTAVTTSPTTGIMNWIELRQNPLSASDEIAMILLDANADVYGMRWTGSGWNTMGVATVWDATASIATKKAIDVEYEQTSGEALFMWGDSVSTDLYYRTWNGTTLSGNTLLDVAAAGVPHWVQLASRPSSNEIMLGITDSLSDLNTRKWSGSAWDTATQHPEHSGAVENNTSRVFDVVWETHSSNPGEAWLVWGNGSTISVKQWLGTAWDTAVTNPTASADDTSFVKLRSDPVSGAVFAGVYEAPASVTDDIWEMHLTGGSSTWSAENTIWAGPASTAEPVYFRMDIATP